MKTPLPLIALGACLLGMAACRSSQPVEESANTAPMAASSASSQNAPLLAAGTSPAGGQAATAGKAPAIAAADSPFVPKNPGLRISRVNVPEKLVALTFDDGPHGQLTPRILDILARNGAKGTFFVLGQNANRFPGILQRAVAEGNEIGSHTWSHAKLTSCGREKLLSEMGRTHDAIIRATGKAPAVMRPPYGAINASTIQTIYSAYGTPAILWDVDTNDWRKPGVQTVINRAVNGARSGSIILVHDIHASTADAIEGIVKGLQARGFRLVTVSELIAAGRRAAGATGPAPLPASPASASPASASVPAAAPSLRVPALPAPTAVAPAGVPAVSDLPDLPEVPSLREDGNDDASATSPGKTAPSLRDPALPALRLRTPALTPLPADSMPEDGRQGETVKEPSALPAF